MHAVSNQRGPQRKAAAREDRTATPVLRLINTPRLRGANHPAAMFPSLNSDTDCLNRVDTFRGGEAQNQRAQKQPRGLRELVSRHSREVGVTSSLAARFTRTTP